MLDGLSNYPGKINETCHASLPRAFALSLRRQTNLIVFAGRGQYQEALWSAKTLAARKSRVMLANRVR